MYNNVPQYPIQERVNLAHGDHDFVVVCFCFVVCLLSVCLFFVITSILGLQNISIIKKQICYLLWRLISPVAGINNIMTNFPFDALTQADR